jgi:hypothetical protein
MMSEDPNGGPVRLGMAATAGAGSGDGVPRRRRAGEFCYHPNEALANAIVKAWSDDEFRTRLLTFPGSDMRNPNYQSTRDALSEVGVNIDKLVPVVLTPQQYATYRRRANQIIFVLPDPLGSVHNLATAQVAMCLHVFGM